MEQIFLYLLILIVPIIAQINITSTYGKYKNVKNTKGLSGFEVARKILDQNGLSNMYIVEVQGNLTDHYDSSQKVVRLSSDIFHGETIAALAVAAHECGHAIQDKENYSWMRIRSFLYPLINFGTTLAYILFFVSIVLQIVDMLVISIVMVFLGLLFEIVTLPVEFDASKKALKNLSDMQLVNTEETSGTEKVLKAAAFTYVASIVSSLLNLLRLVLAYSNRDR